MILFHSCLVHASTSNLSPWNRVSVYLSLCAGVEYIRRFKRRSTSRTPRFHSDPVPARRLPAEGVRTSPLPWGEERHAEAALKPLLAA